MALHGDCLSFSGNRNRRAWPRRQSPPASRLLRTCSRHCTLHPAPSQPAAGLPPASFERSLGTAQPAHLSVYILHVVLYGSAAWVTFQKMSSLTHAAARSACASNHGAVLSRESTWSSQQ